MSDERFIQIDIRKPLYGNFCYIREKYIQQAMIQGKWLRITTPNGTGFCSPQWWKGTGKRMEKEFRIKGRPMVLWGNNAPIDIGLE